MIVPFVTADVFSDRQFGGNQLAVITDARGLSSPQMQAIAAEFGYAETTFVLPPDDPAHTARVRIFTPARELPFAGHPNVGTAFALAIKDKVFERPVGATLVFEEDAGLVPVEILLDQGVPMGAMLTAPQALSTSRTLTPAVVASCVGLQAKDIIAAHHPPLIASVGNPFAFAEVADSATLVRCIADIAQFRAHVPADLASGVHVYVRTGPERIHCRMFGPLLGVPEDAATGSANVALTALLAQLAPEPDLQLSLDIQQGAEMGRPSRLRGEATKVGGRVIQSRIGGACVLVMDGQLRLNDIG